MTKLSDREWNVPQAEKATDTARIDVDGRIFLSGLESTDKPALVEHLQAREISNNTLRIPHPYTRRDADKWFDMVSKSQQKHGQPVVFAIRGENAKLIGAIGFEGLEIGKSHRAEVGYWLAKPYWGQGFMTSVVRAACEYAFGQWGLVKITAHVFDFNPASARVLEKCGFELEGRLQKQYCKQGQYINSLAYALFRRTT